MGCRTMPEIIEWDDDGYPTEESLAKLRQAVSSHGTQDALRAFYGALRQNYYDDSCGPERVEVRGEQIDVWGYHTMGWSGNESIIAALQETWLWGWLLERYDAGGHFYFKHPDTVPGLREGVS